MQVSAADEAVKGSDIFEQVIRNQKNTDAALDNYERIERVEIRKTGGDAKPSEVRVWRVFPAGTGMDKIPLTAAEKPANSEAYIAELQKLEKQLVWAAQQGAAQQEAYARQAKKRAERGSLIEATHRAFNFTLEGKEKRGDGVLLKYRMTPNPGFKPASRNETVFTKVTGYVWIDENSSELARIEGEVTEDISVALFLAKVYKGSHFMQEKYELFPGIWLPTYTQYDFDGRRFLLPVAIHERTFYKDYKRVGPPGEAVRVVRDELDRLAKDTRKP